MVVQGGSLVSGDLGSRELVHYQGRQAGLHREGHEPREPSMEFDRRVLDPVLMPPVPKPILLPVEPPARLNSTGFTAKVLGVYGMEYGGVPGYEGESVHNQGFHTPRGCGSGNWGVDCQGYPVSPGGTVIRPPPIPPPREACRSLAEAAVPGVGDARMQAPNTGVIGSSVGERPEEPAKYISELPKLPALDVSTSAVACGNWMAQLRQVFAGLSPSALVWYQAVEMAATKCYQRWLVADPLDRLSLDPGGVVAVFDEVKFQRVESRAVSLMLAAIPQSLRDEAVSNRWLTTASLLFRVQCVYQPGGSSERSTLLRQLTLPETVSTVTTAVAMLRKWQQHFYRVRELGASMPDPSLLLAGVDKATAGLLGQHPALGFRVNAFRHRVALDYNPTVPTVVQLVRLIQAECEALALGQEGQVPDKKARAAAARAEAQNEGSVPKAPAVPKGGELSGNPGVKALEGGKGEKGKGKGKGKFEAGEPKPCFSFDEGKGCKFGDSCRFRHDRVQARKSKRCLACGQEGHFRPDCPIVAPANRQVVTPDPSSLKAGAKQGSPKAKVTPQAKGISEDNSATGQRTEGSSGSVGTGNGQSSAQEALFAEAAKLLKGVSLKPLQVPSEGVLSGFGIDRGWLMSAVANASDPLYAVVDSGATNALRPADPGEVAESQVIRVDLASGGTQLHINKHGTLLSEAACQVIIPAGYLVQLGFSIVWGKKGCTIRRKGRIPLEVTVVKGCPLIDREIGLQLLREYEQLREPGLGVSVRSVGLDEGLRCRVLDFVHGWPFRLLQGLFLG